jgi:5-(carboxyamino)imidazole ribonucleotide synthase
MPLLKRYELRASRLHGQRAFPVAARFLYFPRLHAVIMPRSGRIDSCDRRRLHRVPDTQPIVGMVGAGQLARMTAQAAIPLAITFKVLAASPDESAALVTPQTRYGDYRSLDDLQAFAAECDVVTFDHEHVPSGALLALEQAGFTVRPSPSALRYAQDKLAMRDKLAEMGLPIPRYDAVKSLDDVRVFGSWPVVLKAVSGGYDGKGVWVCSTEAEAAEVLRYGIPLMAEEFVPFVSEAAALVARSPHKQGAAYPIAQTVQVDGICREVIAPAPGLPSEVGEEASSLALRIASELDVTGLLAVELFVTESGLVVNELAMRPHNSGHWTQDGAVTSQFEQHLRAVLDLPLGSPAPVAEYTVMANVLGGTDPDVYDRYLHVMALDPGVRVHMYDKPVRPGRKIGHVNVSGSDLASLRDRARRAASYLRWGHEDDV